MQEKVLKNRLFFPFKRTSMHTYKRANWNTAQKPKSTTSTAPMVFCFFTFPNSLLKPKSQLIVLASDQETLFLQQVSKTAKWNNKKQQQNNRNKLFHIGFLASLPLEWPCPPALSESICSGTLLHRKNTRQDSWNLRIGGNFCGTISRGLISRRRPSARAADLEGPALCTQEGKEESLWIGLLFFVKAERVKTSQIAPKES